MDFCSNILRASISVAAVAILTACGSAKKIDDAGSPSPTSDPKPASAASASGGETQTVGQLRETIEVLTRKLNDMDLRLTTLAEKVNFAQTGVEQMLRSGAPVSPHASAVRGAPIPVGRTDYDPGFSFVNDEPVQKYRDARLLLEAGKQTDAIVAFSAFLRDHADHPLAGSAQYHIGRAYADKGENKLARDELQRVLISYDRSSHVPETLALLAETEEKLDDKESSNRHRQQLLSLFPQSPAARGMLTAKSTATVPSSALPANEAVKTAGTSAPHMDLPDTGTPVTAPMDGIDEQTESH